jgi:hypothetical protein
VIAGLCETSKQVKPERYAIMGKYPEAANVVQQVYKVLCEAESPPKPSVGRTAGSVLLAGSSAVISGLAIVIDAPVGGHEAWFAPSHPTLVFSVNCNTDSLQ